MIIKEKDVEIIRFKKQPDGISYALFNALKHKRKRLKELGFDKANRIYYALCIDRITWGEPDDSAFYIRYSEKSVFWRCAYILEKTNNTKEHKNIMAPYLPYECIYDFVPPYCAEPQTKEECLKYLEDFNKSVLDHQTWIAQNEQTKFIGQNI